MGYIRGSKSETHDISGRSVNLFVELDRSLKFMTPRVRSEFEFVFLE